MNVMLRCLLLAAPNRVASWREVAKTVALGIAVFTALIGVILGGLFAVKMAGL